MEFGNVASGAKVDELCYLNGVFLEQYEVYGFKNKSALIWAALNHLRREIEAQALKQSADLCTEVYEEDEALQELTESALKGWPA